MAAIIREVGDSKVIEHNGASFTIRTIDHKTYSRLMSKLVLARMALNPNGAEIQSDDIKRLQSQDFEKYLECNQAIESAYEEFIRYGVMNHAGILKKDKSEVVFQVGPDGRVAEETLELYRSQRWIMTLGGEVLQFNSITEQEAKN